MSGRGKCTSPVYKVILPGHRDGNELDTLDGVQLQWFVGAKRDVAKFHETAVGPIVNLTPLRSGKAQVLIALDETAFLSPSPS